MGTILRDWGAALKALHPVGKELPGKALHLARHPVSLGRGAVTQLGAPVSLEMASCNPAQGSVIPEREPPAEACLAIQYMSYDFGVVGVMYIFY